MQKNHFSGEATVVGYSGPCSVILEFKYGHGDLGSPSVFWNLENGSSSLAMEDLAFNLFVYYLGVTKTFHQVLKKEFSHNSYLARVQKKKKLWNTDMWPVISKFTKVLIVGPFRKFVTKGTESISTEA